MVNDSITLYKCKNEVGCICRDGTLPKRRGTRQELDLAFRKYVGSFACRGYCL